jgi:hypothetical protein
MKYLKYEAEPYINMCSQNMFHYQYYKLKHIVPYLTNMDTKEDTFCLIRSIFSTGQVWSYARAICITQMWSVVPENKGTRSEILEEAEMINFLWIRGTVISERC